jgi:hypothetical protein
MSFVFGNYIAQIRRSVRQAAGPVALLATLLAGTAAAQSLNWEGQTGVFVTPFA